MRRLANIPLPDRGEWPPGLLRWWPEVLVGALAFLAYANTFPGGFLGDDLPIVRDDPRVANADWAAVWTGDYWGAGINSGLYRPLTLSTYILNRLLSGPGPLGFHLVNVLLHAGVAVLFCRVLLAVRVTAPRAAFAAALFAVHPVHAEVVNIVTGRAELLAALFLFAALLSALSRHRGHRIAAAVLYAAALFSKEHAIVFLPLLLLFDAFAGDLSLRAVRHGRPGLYAALACITAGWLLLRKWVAASTGVPPDAIYAVDNPLAALAPLSRALTAAKVQGLYVARLLFPARLLPVYTGHALVPVRTVFSWEGAAVLAACALPAVLAVRGWRDRAAYGLGIPFYLAAFAVTSNVLFPIAVFMAERLAYLPSAGFCLAAASLVPAKGAGAAAGRWRPAWGLAAGVVAALCVATLVRNPVFRGQVPLWSDAARRDPGNVRAWHFLALAFQEEGRASEAERAFLSGIAADPAFPDIHTRYGELLLSLGRYEEAVRHAQRGIEASSGMISPAFLVMAGGLAGTGRHAEALEWLDRTGPLYIPFRSYWGIRGKALEGVGDTQGAIDAYRRADSGPGDPQVPYRLAILLLSNGRPAEAEAILRRESERGAGPAFRNLLGVVLAGRGDHGAAAVAFRQAVEMDPGNREYRENLGRAIAAAKGSPPDAEEAVPGKGGRP